MNDTTKEDQNTSTEAGFADLFAQYDAAPEHFTPGEQIEATIASIGNDAVFLDIGAKSEGILAREECLNKEGELIVKEGDRVKVYFLGNKRHEMLFTTRIGGSSASLLELDEAFHNGIPLEGTISSQTKGGYEVQISGSIRAFCPFSQMGLRRPAEDEDLTGQKMLFLIIEIKDNGRTVVISRRRLLEMEREAKREELQKNLKVGDTVSGVITSVRGFGAFIDIDGLEGLIPGSEVSWDSGCDIHQALEPGQQVEVEVLKLDWETDRFSFSLKSTQSNPWDTAPHLFPEGSRHTGKITRLAQFGAFVQLTPGVEGLLHISTLGRGRKLNHPREVVQEGSDIEVTIDKADWENRRLSLSPVRDEESSPATKKTAAKDEDIPDQKTLTSYLAAGKKQSAMGTFGDLLKDKMKGK